MYQEADVKLLLIIYMKKLYIILAGILAGAILGGALYFLCHVIFAPAREYEAVSKIYLTFGKDEDGDTYQYFNGYTWNDLITCEPILDKIMEELPGENREEVATLISADIISDIRLLTITVRTHDMDRSNRIMEALQNSLMNFTSDREEFVSAQIIEHGQAKLVVLEDETVRAVIIGAVVGLIIAVFGLLIWIVSKDEILLPGDVRRIDSKLYCTGVSDTQGNRIDCGACKTWEESRAALSLKDEEIIKIPYGTGRKNIEEEMNQAGKAYRAFEIVGADPALYRLYFGKK